MLHSHQQKHQKFYHDSNLQWDDAFTKSRYSRRRGIQTLYATPQILRNIEASGGGGSGTNGNAPPLEEPADETDDKSIFSINELQLYLSNQAMIMRGQMTSEYEELRIFQNSEMELLLKAKAQKEPEFAQAVEDAKKKPLPWPAVGAAPSKSHVRMPGGLGSHQKSLSPLSQSPSEFPDINLVKRDTSLPPFVRFCVELDVVQRNWPIVARSWTNYVNFFQRTLMDETAFAKGILQDAVRTPGSSPLTVDPGAISTTRQTLDGKIPGRMSQIIAKVLFEMAEVGDIDFRDPPVEAQGNRHGLSILANAIAVEQAFMGIETASTGKVGKATDPRHRS